MYKEKFVSVIIPTYNVSKYIDQTLNSVLSQDYHNFEIIIVDDGSKDDTCKIVEKHVKTSGKINLFVRKHSGNVGKNLNFGIYNAKGDIIAILGADDIWKTDKLSRQLLHLEKYKIICTNANVINENSETIENSYITDFEDNIELKLTHLLKKNYVIASSVLAYKNIFTDNGGFEQEIGIRGEDYYLWLKVAKKNDIFLLNENLTAYRKHTNNLSTHNIKEKIKLFENTIAIRELYLNYNNSEVALASKLGISEFLKDLCKMYYNEREYTNSFKRAKRFLGIYPFKFSILYFKVLAFSAYVFWLQIFNRRKSEI